MGRRAPSAGRRGCAIAALLLLGLAPLAQAREAPLIAVAGDIACGPSNEAYNNGQGDTVSCQQLQTSNLLAGRQLSAVLPLGDLQYDESGSLESYLTSYEPTWGRWKAISHPVVGNHEYDDGLGAQGYWDYWNGVGVLTGLAGERGRGWYAYDVGSWRLIALNTNCSQVACLGSSRQIKFLRDELERHHDRCVLAYMHHPRFSSGIHGKSGRTHSFWKALYRGGADVVLAGHDHIYERLAPQRPSGIPDRKRGLAQFTVGTGGYYLFPLGPTAAPNSEFVYNQTFGVMFMQLARKGYGWAFTTVPSATIVDGGSRRCHNRIDRTTERKRKRKAGDRDGHEGGGQQRPDAGGRTSG